ncbi:MAG: 2-C-methyl-D-erythritol 4-phosphate cytidylyltransferase, partial [Desulfitobacterium hafniense]|nr:2-C-methyl-D-erythritol 4-phosphate cytidylyltransferase [Desulfitobacterium hafniense]
VVIPAAGQGKRMGAPINKQFLNLNGIPVLAHCLKVFDVSPYIAEIVVVGAEEDIPSIERLVAEYRFKKVVSVVKGGKHRQESVFAGVKALGSTIDRVVVHDGARPLLTLDNFHRFLEKSKGIVAVTTAIPVKDTIKQVDQAGKVISTLVREQLKAIQTPQLFDRSILEKAHKQAILEGFVGTDDASLVEWLGYPVFVLEGSSENIKVTTPDDLWVAERILEQRKIGKE